MLASRDAVFIGAVALAPWLAGACGNSSSSDNVADGGEGGTAFEGGPLGDGAGGIDAKPGSDASSESSAPVDAAPDQDNGAPSTNYPAPHAPLPTLTNANHGPVLTAPKVILVLYPGNTYAADLQTFAQKMSSSTYWGTTTSEYGVGKLSYGSTITLTGQTPPASISSTDIETWVEGEIAGGAFGAPDPQAIYTIVYPSSTTITQPNPVSPIFGTVQSCSSFTGYHNNAAVQADGGATKNYAYAVIATCGPDVNSFTSVMSHEWVEASTDPQDTATGVFTLSGGPNSAYYTVDENHAIWAVLGGGEAGDLCEPEGQKAYITPADVGYSVQRTWSNLAASGSHDPCVPEPTEAFFDSAPVLPETVTFSSPYTPTIVTQGITIPVGQSKTIEVDLFSDGDTGGPWTVAAVDLLATYYGSYGIPASLSFAWDRTTGVNGEKLHLTITTTSASVVGNGHGFIITSTLGTGSTARTATWPGMVVD